MSAANRRSSFPRRPLRRKNPLAPATTALAVALAAVFVVLSYLAVVGGLLYVAVKIVRMAWG